MQSVTVIFQFMFADGTCSKWLIADKSAILEFSGTESRNVLRSSEDDGEHKVTFKRDGESSSPHIYVKEGMQEEDLIYAGKGDYNYDGLIKGGGNVFIRRAGKLIRYHSYTLRSPLLEADHLSKCPGGSLTGGLQQCLSSLSKYSSTLLCPPPAAGDGPEKRLPGSRAPCANGSYPQTALDLASDRPTELSHTDGVECSWDGGSLAWPPCIGQFKAVGWPRLSPRQPKCLNSSLIIVGAYLLGLTVLL